MTYTDKTELIATLKLYPGLNLLIHKMQLTKNFKGIKLLKFVQESIQTTLRTSDKLTVKLVHYLFMSSDSVNIIQASMRFHISRTTIYNRINNFLNYLHIFLLPNDLKRLLKVIKSSGIVQP